MPTSSLLSLSVVLLLVGFPIVWAEVVEYFDCCRPPFVPEGGCGALISNGNEKYTCMDSTFYYLANSCTRCNLLPGFETSSQCYTCCAIQDACDSTEVWLVLLLPSLSVLACVGLSRCLAACGRKVHDDEQLLHSYYFNDGVADEEDTDSPTANPRPATVHPSAHGRRYLSQGGMQRYLSDAAVGLKYITQAVIPSNTGPEGAGTCTQCCRPVDAEDSFCGHCGQEYAVLAVGARPLVTAAAARRTPPYPPTPRPPVLPTRAAAAAAAAAVAHGGIEEGGSRGAPASASCAPAPAPGAGAGSTGEEDAGAGATM